MKFAIYEFALMSRFIELGKRYGLQPWELPVEYDSSSGETYLTGTPACTEAYKRFCEMVAALGIKDPATEHVFPHEEGLDMFNALDEAVQNAPRKWMR